jgi:hypothetical protein
MELNMTKCLTIQLALSKVSGCLVEKPECSYAHKFGFSFVCRHSEHKKYYAHLTGILTKKEAFERYDSLRLKRRDEFTANLEKTSRNFFCLQTDFFGQPLSNKDLDVYD